MPERARARWDPRSAQSGGDHSDRPCRRARRRGPTAGSQRRRDRGGGRDVRRARLWAHGCSLKDAGYWLVGLAPGAPESLGELEPPRRIVVVLGGEGEGLRPLVRRGCDFVTSIPMAPGVDSLNVAVAAGIALYALV
ncbi:MAG: RNA methyltransferase [Deltaproteobacteria bacterium]|nr:MAG: RNA methyltransferase [Deltaproteobacteria bacterium]